MKTKTRIIVESAVMIALATVLSMIKIYDAPYGGSVTLMSALPIVLIAVRYGMRTGFAAGFVYSVLQLILGLENVAYVPGALGILLCCLFDYIVPFTLFGLCGAFKNFRLFKNERVNRLVGFTLGTVLVLIIRYVCHVITGVVIWYELDLEWYADDPTHIVNLYGPWLFSLIYNATYMIPEIAVTAVGAAALSPVNALFKTKK